MNNEYLLRKFIRETLLEEGFGNTMRTLAVGGAMALAPLAAHGQFFHKNNKQAPTQTTTQQQSNPSDLLGVKSDNTNFKQCGVGKSPNLDIAMKQSENDAKIKLQKETNNNVLTNIKQEQQRVSQDGGTYTVYTVLSIAK